MRKKLAKLIEKDGFYIILFICVCVVAISTVVVSKQNLTGDSEYKSSQEEDFVIVDEKLKSEPSISTPEADEREMVEDPIEEIRDLEEAKETMAEEEEEGEGEGESEEELEEIEEDINLVDKETSVESSETMIVPVEGVLGTDYTRDNLIYSETLEEWTVHKGIDILAEEGTPVVAALSGVVQEVYNDQLWGIVIIIEHGNGLVTKYANLSTGDMVKEGSKVNKGDIIGKVGKTASIEMMMEPHVHFEIIKDGISIDPREHIPAFINRN